MERLRHRSGIDALKEHLQRAHDITITDLTRLDIGVFEVARDGGPAWIARVFQASRSDGAARGDAQLLSWLDERGFPAERPVGDDPVSTFNGQEVLVTEAVTGRRAPANAATFRELGRLIGWLHEFPRAPAGDRLGGAWHHIVGQGSPREEIDATLELVRAARARVDGRNDFNDGELYANLLAAVERLDDCADLPSALIHPDAVPDNAIASRDRPITLIDWSGAGRGPRIWALGWLLWAAGPRHAEAAIAGYRTESQLDAQELERLRGAVAARPVLFAARSFADGTTPLAEASSRLERISETAARIAARVRTEPDAA
jgi:Ser/Thr protein kinase RdoA (MazF antagonist)